MSVSRDRNSVSMCKRVFAHNDSEIYLHILVFLHYRIRGSILIFVYSHIPIYIYMALGNLVRTVPIWNSGWSRNKNKNVGSLVVGPFHCLCGAYYFFQQRPLNPRTNSYSARMHQILFTRASCWILHPNVKWYELVAISAQAVLVQVIWVRACFPRRSSNGVWVPT